MKTNRIRLLTTLLGLTLAGLVATGCDDEWECLDSGVVTADSGADSALPDAKTDTAPKPDAKPSKITSELIILHTNDLHSHLMGHGPEVDYSPATTGDDKTLGGFARLAAKIKSERTAAGKTPLLLLDGGDFIMGTAFPMLGLTKSAELTEMGKMGYDAIVIGNHEFDWGPAALAGFIKTAVTAGFKVPLLATNMKFDATKTEDDTLKALETSGAIKRTFVKTLSNGVKVGFFGIMGKGAASVAPASKPVTFEAAATSAKAAIKKLKTTDKVDLVIAVSHSGTDSTGKKGDDADMAAAAPGIDVIISGHTHNSLAKPVQVGSTWIIQSGSYGRNLGKLVLNLHENKTTSVKSYKLLPIDDTIKGDAATQTRIDGYIKDIDTLLAASGLSYKKVLAETSADLTLPDYQEALLGNLITDAYLGVISKLQTTDPPVIALESPGVIRDEIFKGKTGKLWFADVFRALPLGIGPDKKPGYPLLTIYLNGTEVKTAAEVTALANTFENNDYFLHMAGLRMEYDPKKLIFGRVTKLTDSAGKAIEIKSTTKCYKVAANYYIYSLMGLLKNLGAPPIVPKQKDCKTAITDITKHFVDADPKTAGTQELKPHQALMQFMTAFPDTDTDKIPDVPAKYTKLDPKKPRIKKL